MGSIATESSNHPTYSTLPTRIKGTPPPVIVFFSFLDETSYLWTTKNRVTQNIRRSLPAGTEVHRYHVYSFSTSGGNFGHELTHAWAVATHLHVDDKIIIPMFEKVLKEKVVIDVEGIREVFWRDAGVDHVRFDRAWVDPSVVAEMRYQDELTRKLPSEQKLPCIVITGQRIINGQEIQHMSDDEDFGPKVGKLVRELLDKP